MFAHIYFSLQYITSKKSKSTALWSDSDSSSDGESDDSESEKEESLKSRSPSKNKPESESGSESDEDEDSGSDGPNEKKSPQANKMSAGKTYRYCIKMRGLPPSIKEGQIREFFKPVVPTQVKIPRNAKGKQTFSKSR